MLCAFFSFCHAPPPPLFLKRNPSPAVFHVKKIKFPLASLPIVNLTVNSDQHDAYTCSKFPNSRPFPTRRLANYQHVGQVFTPDGPGGADKARMGDINGFMRGRETPLSCRKQPGWKFG